MVLSRKAGERIFIGNDVTITVVLIDRGKVRLGISAPADTAIHREEIAPEGHPLAGRAVAKEGR